MVVVVEEGCELRCSAGVFVLRQRGGRSGGRLRRVLLSDAEVRDVAYCLSVCLYRATLCCVRLSWQRWEARLGVWT